MIDDFSTPEEMGRRFGVTPDTVILWARRGRIPSYRLSRKVIRFRLPEVIAALEGTTASPADPSPPSGAERRP